MPRIKLTKSSIDALPTASSDQVFWDSACPGFGLAAAALLDAGANGNTGFYSTNHDLPEFESVIYGAAGVAHHPELTRLLLARGADPNDGETPYHAPQTLDD